MLLMLYARTDSRPVRAKELALVCDVAFTTALRWQLVLEDQGWISRTPDPADLRATDVKLTDKGRGILDSFFTSLRCLQPGQNPVGI
jgi:DNA-binding MarR family transcriptional regulator